MSFFVYFFVFSLFLLPFGGAQWIGGTLSWERADSFSTTVIFTVSAVLEPSHYLQYCTSSICPGATCVSNGTKCTGFAGASVPLGALTASGDAFQFGDGQSLTMSSTYCDMVVFDTRGAQVECEFIHTYNTTTQSKFTAYYASPSGMERVLLVNNAWKPYGLATNVSLSSAGNSPAAALLPIVDVHRQATDVSVVVDLAFGDSDFADVLQFSFTPPNLFGNGSATQAAGLSLDSSTGRLTWNVSGAPDGNYSVSLQIADSTGNSITADVILRLITHPANRTYATVSKPTIAQTQLWKGQASTITLMATYLAGSSPVFHGTTMPNEIQVSLTTLSNASSTLTFQISAASSWNLTDGVYPICILMEYPATYNGTGVAAPITCFVLKIYEPCLHFCTSPTNGVCRTSIYGAGTCLCNPGYFLRDCRLLYHDLSAVDANGIPHTIAAEIVPNVRATVGNVTIVVNMSIGTPIGTDLWLHLPQGWHFDPASTQVLWLQNITNNSCGTTPTISLVHTNAQDTIEIRCNDSNVTFTASGLVSFLVTNVKAANNCNKAQWRLEARSCYHEDLFNQHKIYVRRCPDPVTPLQWSFLYDHSMACSICNSCDYQFTDASTGVQHLRCEENGVVFWREGPMATAAGSCCPLGNLC